MSTAVDRVDSVEEAHARYPAMMVEDLYSAAGAMAYEAIAGRDGLEVRELIALVAATEGPILDVAAGAGRLTLPLLTLRRPVTALDLSASMLGILESKLRRLPPATRQRCTLVEADMTSFALDERFGAIVVGTTSISLLPDAAARRRALIRLREHLAPGGRLLITTVDVQGHAREPIRLSVGDTEYTVFEEVLPEKSSRTMTVLALTDGVARAFTSTVAIVPASSLANEIRAAGLRVVDTVDAITGESHYRDTIVVAMTPLGAPS